MELIHYVRHSMANVNEKVHKGKAKCTKTAAQDDFIRIFFFHKKNLSQFRLNFFSLFLEKKEQHTFSKRADTHTHLNKAKREKELVKVL